MVSVTVQLDRCRKRNARLRQKNGSKSTRIRKTLWHNGETCNLKKHFQSEGHCLAQGVSALKKKFNYKRIRSGQYLYWNPKTKYMFNPESGASKPDRRAFATFNSSNLKQAALAALGK